MGARFALCTLAGVLLAMAVPPPYGRNAAGVAAFVAVLAAVLWSRDSHRAAASLACLLGAFAWSAFVVQGELAARWPPGRDGERVLAEARIVSIPTYDAESVRFDARLILDSRMGGQRLRARIEWRHAPATLRVGDRRQLALSLRAPRSTSNGVPPDMERVWFREHIHALGRVVTTGQLERDLGRGHGSIDRLRERIAQRIARDVRTAEATALIQALAVGYTGGMHRTQWQVFSATGTTHLVAISGMHVTMFALVIMAASRRLWPHLGPLRHQLRRESFAAMLGITAAGFYALLAGFSVPTQRTVIMLAAWLGARSIARAQGAAHSLWISMTVVLAIDPLAVLSAGFWLSFGAVLTLIVATGPQGESSWWRDGLRTQFVVSLALVPVTLALFGAFSLASFIVNFAAIPAFSIGLVPLILASVAAMPLAPAFAALGLRCAEWSIEAGWPWLEAAASWPHALVTLDPPLWAYLILAPAVGIAILPWPWRLRFTAMAAALPMIVPRQVAPAPGTLRVTAFEVNRGVALVLQADDRTWLYGTGEAFGTEGARSARLLVPWLQRAGVGRIEQLILPRLDRGAAQGAAQIASRVPIKGYRVREGWPGGPSEARACSAETLEAPHPIRLELDANCELHAVAGIFHLRISGPSLTLDGVPVHERAIRIELDGNLGAVEITRLDSGYAWPWRSGSPDAGRPV